MNGLDVTIGGPVVVPLPRCGEDALAALWERRDSGRARSSPDEDLRGKDGRMRDGVKSNKCRDGNLLIFVCRVT